ncbi:MAG: hypothetical protein KDB40_03795 [Acidimicrobiales bacterium]|nr:hypothetical protein [Acidimicrobiales bacterium]MCB9395316.1 hypothetical protein [Acidimicrobiaceae bacterium]
MNTNSFARRRALLAAARGGAVLSAAMLAISVVGAFGASAEPLVAGAPATEGLSISVESGNSSTPFSLALAAPNNVCPGDSAVDGYRWHNFLVSDDVDVAVLKFNASGPIAPAGSKAFPLLSATGGTPQVNKLTGTEPKGMIIGTVELNFAQYPDNALTAGTYKIGYACTKAGTTERYWQMQFTVTPDADAGGPAKFTWTAAAIAPTTTTTSTTSSTTSTTSTSSTTSTTVAGGSTTTSTTVAGGSTTSTSVAGSTTTSTTQVASAAAASSSSGGFSVGSSGTGSGSGGTIPETGPSHTIRIIVWSVLLVVFGRMAVLLARPIRVIPVGSA